MARHGIAPAAMADALRHALQTLELERAGDRSDDLLREVAARVRAKHDPAAIVRTMVARGVTTTTAQHLTDGARTAWESRRARLRHTRVAWTAAAALIMLVMVQGALWRRPAARLTAVPQEATVVAKMTPMPNAVVLARRLNVRSGPHKHDPLVTELSANDRLVVIGREEKAGRYQVLLPDARQGWVRAEHVRIDVPLEMIPVYSVSPD
jgi:uncharacterized protein YgiM (DUF1202 family)